MQLNSLGSENLLLRVAQIFMMQPLDWLVKELAAQGIIRLNDSKTIWSLEPSLIDG